MKLKWFKGPHFELQTKDQKFEKSMHIIWLQTMITMNSFPSSIKLTWHYNLFRVKSPPFDVKLLVLDDFIFIKLCKNHMIESIFIKFFINGQVCHVLIHKNVKNTFWHPKMDTIVCKHLRPPFYNIQLASSQIQRSISCDKECP
jgi:hypothetical protein